MPLSTALCDNIIWQTMCFHLGMTEAFAWNYGSENQRFTDWKETSEILQEIHEEFVKDGGLLQYSHHVSFNIPDIERTEIEL